MAKHLTVLGVDPGCGLTGLAVARMFPQSGEIIDAYSIESGKSSKVGERLEKLHTELLKALEGHKPDLVGIESIFFFKNQKTAMDVSQGRGVIVLACAQKKIPVVDVSPPQVKMAICSYGRADKKQVEKMVTTLFGLKEPLKPDDVSDAAAIAWTAYQLRSKDAIMSRV